MLIHTEPDPDSIILIIDQAGMKGKSFFVNYLLRRYPMEICKLSNGKPRHVIQSVINHKKIHGKHAKVLIMDIVRAKTVRADTLSGLEEVKTGDIVGQMGMDVHSEMY